MKLVPQMLGKQDPATASGWRSSLGGTPTETRWKEANGTLGSSYFLLTPPTALHSLSGAPHEQRLTGSQLENQCALWSLIPHKAEFRRHSLLLRHIRAGTSGRKIIPTPDGYLMGWWWVSSKFSGIRKPKGHPPTENTNGDTSDDKLCQVEQMSTELGKRGRGQRTRREDVGRERACAPDCDHEWVVGGVEVGAPCSW